jgi:glutathione-regulated potassium-efflux system ancillary protein KefC
MDAHIPAWLTYTLIYLSAAVIAVPLSKWLGLGSIIGYLAAGVAIGPFGLGLIKDAQATLHFAEFGVVLMLFVVGLELEPKRLWTLRRSIFGWGSAQVALCTLAIFGAGLAFGVEWKVALVAALGLSLSSTAIALQVMNERNMLPTTAGQNALSILLFQDIAAIPMLALIPLLGVAASNGAAQSGWVRAGIVIGVIAAVIVVGRLLVRPALRWIARSKTPEIFTAAALLLVVAISALMASISMSMALGAFLAGVLLAESEFRHELETDLEPFKGLLLGLFFIAVGMSIDFGALMKSPLVVAAIVFVFLLLKAAVIFAIAKPMGIAYQDRPVFTLLLAQGGEFAFVVFQVAAGAKIFPSETSSLLVGAVAISMLLSPLVLVLLDKFLLPRFANCNTKKMEDISEPQDAPVVIAGFGRYGQIVGRLLMANGIRVTILDHDADRIESARGFGYRVFYGDATRLELLRIAGAEKAKVLVVAVDSVDDTNAIVDQAQAHFKQAKLIVRVRDLVHAYAMIDRGVELWERELFEGSLKSGQQVMLALGMEESDVIERAKAFALHNVTLLHKTHKVRHDENAMRATAKQARAELEAQMAQDRRGAVAPDAQIREQN